MFYVHENWTNTFAKVHSGECPFCNDGEGFLERRSSAPSGQWLGPFVSREAAHVAAQAAADSPLDRDVWQVGTCRYCGR